MMFLCQHIQGMYFYFLYFYIFYFITFIFYFIFSRKVFLIMHYCEGGDLGKVITMAAKNNQPLPEVQILKWISQVNFYFCFFLFCLEFLLFFIIKNIISIISLS